MRAPAYAPPCAPDAAGTPTFAPPPVLTPITALSLRYGMGRCVIPVEKCAVATLLSGLAEKKIDVVFSLHTHGMVQTTQKKAALWQGQTGWLKSGARVVERQRPLPPRTI